MPPSTREKWLILSFILVIGQMWGVLRGQLGAVPRQEVGPDETLLVAQNSPRFSAREPEISNDIIQSITGVHNISSTMNDRAEMVSSVDYKACCGLGHKLLRTSMAHFVATNVASYSLRVHWGTCGMTEVFHYLFGPFPVSNDIKSVGRTYFFNNEVPGYRKTMRVSFADNCHMMRYPDDQFRDSVSFYRTLQARFRGRQHLERFRNEHEFANHTVLGLHIRAGNGEMGHFERNARGIPNITLWIDRLVETLLARTDPNPLVFLATDTASVIHLLQKKLLPIPVITFPQPRRQAGTGVDFGEAGRSEAIENADECLRKWQATMADNLLLSSSDVLIAARPSSFTASAPMHLVLTRNGSFCELSKDATKLACFQDLNQSKCLQAFEHHKIFYRPSFDAAVTNKKKMVDRRNDGFRCLPNPVNRQQRCLPYDWTNYPDEVHVVAS